MLQLGDDMLGIGMLLVEPNAQLISHFVAHMARNSTGFYDRVGIGDLEN